MPGNSMEMPLMRNSPITAHRTPITPSTSPTVERSLLASFRGEAVYPLVGLRAGQLRKRLAEPGLQPLDTVLAPPLDGQRLQEIHLALTCLATPLGGGLLRLPVRRSLFLHGSILGRIPGTLPAAPDGGWSTTGGRGRRGVVAVGEFLHGGRAHVHGVAQGTGLRPGLCHPDQVRRDVAPHVVRARVAYPREAPLVVHLGRGLHDGDVAIRLVGDLDQIRVDSLQSQAVSLVEEPCK